MHLIHCQPEPYSSLFYHRNEILTRVNSLPYLFKKLRIHRNLTKESLSKKFNVSENYIYTIEAGIKPPSLHYSLMSAEEFGINPEWVKRKWLKEMMVVIEERLKKRLRLEN